MLIVSLTFLTTQSQSSSLGRVVTSILRTKAGAARPLEAWAPELIQLCHILLVIASHRAGPGSRGKERILTSGV